MKDAAVDVAASELGVDSADIDLGAQTPLNPSQCVAIAAWERDSLDAEVLWLVSVGDEILVGGDDQALLTVGRRCFLDQGILPDGDAASTLALRVGQNRLLKPITEQDGTRLLRDSGHTWHAPIVAEDGDGFVITCFAQNVETGAVFEVTSSVGTDSASTDNREI